MLDKKALFFTLCEICLLIAEQILILIKNNLHWIYLMLMPGIFIPGSHSNVEQTCMNEMKWMNIYKLIFFIFFTVNNLEP